MSDQTSNLQSHLGYWLRFVSNHVSHAFRLKVEALGVTVAEWVVLRLLLDAGPIHPSRIARSLGMTRGAVSKLVDRLSAKNLVACRADHADRRYQTVALAPSGRKLVPILAALADQNDREFFGHLSPQDRETILALLKTIVQTHNLRALPVD
jgi:DNA-binding MarR family transcriptional regulator